MPITEIFPPTDSNAYWFDESLSTDNRTVCASKPNGPRKLKSTVLDDVTVARVTIKNRRRYDWMLARRALHSVNGWLMCKVFSKSIGLFGFSLILSNGDASLFTRRTRGKAAPIVSDFCTVLYQLHTLMYLVDCSISRQSSGTSVRFSPRAASNGTSRMRRRISAFVRAATSVAISGLFNTTPTQ